MFCKISQNLQQKTCVPVTSNFTEKETLFRVFEFYETFKDYSFNRAPPVAASGLFF